MVYLYGRGGEGEISDLLVLTYRRRRDQWFTCPDVAEKERSVVYLYGRIGEGEISGLLVRTCRRRRDQWFTCTDVSEKERSVVYLSGRGGEGDISGLLVRTIAGAHYAFTVRGTETTTGNHDSVTIDDDVIRGSGIDAIDTDDCVFRHHTTGKWSVYSNIYKTSIYIG